MQIHQLQPTHQPKRRKARVGRGGKRGTYSGHGVKGQKSRSGRRMRPAARDFIQRLPKLRGIKNKSLNLTETQVVNLDSLASRFKGSLVTPEILVELNFIKHADQPVKILGRGSLKEALTFKGVIISKSAQEKIKAAGGKIE